MAVPIKGPELLELHCFAMVIGERDVYGAGQNVLWIKVFDGGGRRSGVTRHGEA